MSNKLWGCVCISSSLSKDAIIQRRRQLPPVISCLRRCDKRCSTISGFYFGFSVMQRINFFRLIFPPHPIQNEIDAIDKRKRMHGAKIIKYQNWILCSVSYFIIRQDAQPDKTVVFHPYIYIRNIKMILMPPTDKNSTLQNEQP